MNYSGIHRHLPMLRFTIYQLTAESGDLAIWTVTRDLDFLGGTEWLENDRDSGNFESHPLVIAAGSDAYIGDLDGDDDLDILTSAFDDQTIRWHENADGVGNFGNALTAGTGRAVGIGDFGSDGDLDILSSANEEVAWHENVDETGVFDVRRVIAKEIPEYSTIRLGDLDGDGDVDLLVSSRTYDEVSHALIDQETFWLENLGNAERFSEKQVIATDVDSVVDVAIADMDGDGDLDVVAGEYKRGISWYDNLNGKGSFGEKKVIGELLPYEQVYSIDVLDMDNDGDLDVVAAEIRVHLVSKPRRDSNTLCSPDDRFKLRRFHCRSRRHRW